MHDLNFKNINPIVFFSFVVKRFMIAKNSVVEIQYLVTNLESRHVKLNCIDKYYFLKRKCGKIWKKNPGDQEILIKIGGLLSYLGVLAGVRPSPPPSPPLTLNYELKLDQLGDANQIYLWVFPKEWNISLW